MLATIIVPLLALAASMFVSAAVCPTNNSFWIHPVGRPNLCISVYPEDYILDEYKDTARLNWAALWLANCNGHWSQEWEWFEADGKKLLRNPGQLDKWVDPPYPDGMVIALFQYRFPVTIGTHFSLHWYWPFAGSVPEREWTYTPGRQLLNGWKTADGHASCMNYSAYENGWDLHIDKCRDNDAYQQWQLEPVN